MAQWLKVCGIQTRRFWNTAFRKTARRARTTLRPTFSCTSKKFSRTSIWQELSGLPKSSWNWRVWWAYLRLEFECGFDRDQGGSAIDAGCTVVIKPSEMSAMQTEVLMDAFHEAGLPPGVINFVNGLGEVVGAELTKSPDIQKIAFTGSTLIGKLVAKNSLDTMKRLTLELGGRSPNIILDHADFSTAIPMAVAACYLNNGQACIAASRLIVPEDRLDEVKRLVRTAVEKIKMGDPRNRDVTLGPLASVKHYKRVQEYIKSGIDEGAELVIGGEGHPSGLEDGNFVKPTVFTNVTRDMRIAKEEIFGPVLSILTYKTEAEAIEIADDTKFGLIAYVSSADPERANRVAGKLSAGRVLINTIVHDPFAPFGGFKQSGMGREGGIFGLQEYL
jgi:aldehyde dehydrogenase (NAD+)